MVKVGFIGGGNMAGAIIGGLIAAGFNAADITVSDPYEPTRLNLKKSYKVNITLDNNAVLNSSNSILILATKPQVLEGVVNGIAEMVDKYNPLIISIAAGITIESLVQWLSKGSKSVPAIVRCMPNTPALVSEGCTGMYASANVSASQKDLATMIMKSVSKALYWVDKESLIDVVTGLSGSGPAYFFLFVEAMERAGVELGLPLEVARGLAAQTCLGAGRMLTTSSDIPSELRKKVTSPNGTTHAAIVSMENDGVRDIIIKAVKAATERGEELGRMMASNSKL